MDAPSAPTATGDPSASDSGLRTFTGVFRPIVIVVLGAMLALRTGWLVGNAGLFGAWVLIAAAFTITGTSALSLASIVTNMRLRSGGAFAIVSGALGLEAGGAIGIPLYLAQTTSSMLYLFAFAEAAERLLPAGLDPRLVVAAGFAAVGAVVLVSTAWVRRIQAVTLVIFGAGALSALAGWPAGEARPAFIGSFSAASPVQSFALFFPAATGMMVGVGMSGTLAKPRRSLPYGLLGAWAATLLAYVVGAAWYGTIAPRAELLANPLVFVDRAAWPALAHAGLLCGTLTAALSVLFVAPRLLAAMAEHGVVPFSAWLSRKAGGEPRNAVVFTLGLAALGVSAGSLDAIAPYVTSFFVMTFLAINLVVVIEQSIGQVSWRPTWRLPTAVPVLGVVACLAGLVLSSPAGGLPEVMFVGGVYLWLARARRVETTWETVQSGVAQTLAAWAALRASQMKRSPRTWKPDLLVPIADAEEARALFPVVEAVVAWRGSVKFVATREAPPLGEALDAEVAGLRARGRYAGWHFMPEEAPGQGARLSINAMQGTFFASNLVVLSLDGDPAVLTTVTEHAQRNRVGVIVVGRPFTEPPRRVAVWLADRGELASWTLDLRVANLDLPVLLGILLTRPTDGAIDLVTVLRDPAEREAATRFLGELIELGRVPSATARVLEGDFLEALGRAPDVDVHVFGLGEAPDPDRMRAIAAVARAPCLFVRDSGLESALA